VRALEHVVVEERREVLGLPRLRIAAQAHDAVRDEEEEAAHRHQVDDDQRGAEAHEL
jgi:hypothetical protein